MDKWDFHKLVLRSGLTIRELIKVIPELHKFTLVVRDQALVMDKEVKAVETLQEKEELKRIATIKCSLMREFH
jgi:hypothetical protein